MACIIQDYLYAYNANLSPIPQIGFNIYAVPASDAISISISGSFRTVTVNPNISNNSAYKFGQVSTTDGTGSFSFTLPYGATEIRPANTPYNIVFPDGKIATGIVPSVAGPLTLDTLVNTYGWSWTTSAVYVAPSSGVAAQGTAVFSAATSYTILFLTPMVAANYQITLGCSTDSVSTGFSPQVFWSNKTQTGFIINTSTSFTGSIDWMATL